MIKLHLKRLQNGLLLGVITDENFCEGKNNYNGR